MSAVNGIVSVGTMLFMDQGCNIRDPPGQLWNIRCMLTAKNSICMFLMLENAEEASKDPYQMKFVSLS